MAKIKVKLRRSTIDGKAGTIYYIVSHRSRTRIISTNIRIKPQHWDWSKNRPLPHAPNCESVLNRLRNDIAAFRQIIRKFEAACCEFTADDIADDFRHTTNHTVLAFMNEQMKFLNSCNKHGTATNYRRAATKLSAFLGNRDIRFTEFTAQFIEQYRDYMMSTGLIRNSQSFHMRILRAVYNKAVRCGYVVQTFPFRDVYTGIDHTRKRAVSEEVIIRLIHLEIRSDDTLSLARDIFLFSFYTRGMAFVDIAYLRKTDIHEEVIKYARHKTGKHLAVRIEPCIRAIIDRYSLAVRNTPYVFPILKSKDKAECFNQYRSELRIYNDRLKRLSQILGLKCSLTSYSSRHSWATTARNHNVPLAIISAGMGHSSERTTQIYLSSMDNSLIDNANRGILDTLNKTFSCRRSGRNI